MLQHSITAKGQFTTLSLKGARQREKSRIFPLGDVELGTFNKAAARDWWGDAQIVEKPFVFLR